MSVYMKIGVDRDGLNLYHCIRGTNSVEGAVHNPIRRNFAALHASPALADALIADFRHRHNVVGLLINMVYNIVAIMTHGLIMKFSS